MEEIVELKQTYKLLGSYSLTSNHHKINAPKDSPQVKRFQLYQQQILDSKDFHTQHNFTVNGQRVFFFLASKFINRRPIKLIRNFKIKSSPICKAFRNIVQYDSSSILLKFSQSCIIMNLMSMNFHIINIEHSKDVDQVIFNGLQVSVNQEGTLKIIDEEIIRNKNQKYETQYVGHQSNFYQEPVLAIQGKQLFLGCASGIYIYDNNFTLLEIVELSRLIIEIIVFDQFMVAQIHNQPKQVTVWKKQEQQMLTFASLDFMKYNVKAIDLLSVSASGQYLVFTTSESVSCLKAGKVHYTHNLDDDEPEYIAAAFSSDDNYLAISTPQYLVFVDLNTKQDWRNEYKKSFGEYDRIKAGFSMDNEYCAVYSEISKLTLYSPDHFKDVIYINKHHICQVAFGVGTIIVQDQVSILIYDFEGCLMKSRIFNDLYGFFISTSMTMIGDVIYCRNRSDQIVQIRATDLEIMKQDKQPSHIQSCEPVIFINEQIMLSIGVACL